MSSPKYKLTYWNGRGLGEVIRQLFALGNIDFEDVRVSREEWPLLKKTLPFEQMPVLEVDGVKIPQSAAISRFIARKIGHAGETEVEQAIVDAIADQYKDFYAQIAPYYFSRIVFEKADDEAEDAKQNVLIPARDRFMGYMTNYLKQSKTGFLAGGPKVTFADLILTEHVTIIQTAFPEYIDGFPEVVEHTKKILEIPAIKEWVAKRKPTPF